MAVAWANERGSCPAFAGNLALVVTELANNLANHTRGGVILLRNLGSPDNCGVEILSLDTGPGVANFSECLRDGYSTGGTAGTGLGAVRRASAAFEVHSQTGIGTALRSELWVRPPASQTRGFIFGGASVPLTGEVECGDTWAARSVSSDRVRVIVADGLGHGEFAADASRKAVEVFSRSDAHPLPRMMEDIHGALRATRGAAVAVAEIDSSSRRVSYVGVGNISATIVRSSGTTSLVSQNGTAGAQIRTLKEFSYEWTSDAALVMQSDGVKTQWHLDRYLGLAGRHPGLVAGVLFRDFQRPTDDSTVVVLRAVSL